MGFQFATCNRRTALGFLQQLYPDYDVIDTPDVAADLLNMVESDAVRVLDPNLHKGAVVASNNWKPGMDKDVLAAIEKLTAKPKEGE